MIKKTPFGGPVLIKINNYLLNSSKRRCKFYFHNWRLIYERCFKSCDFRKSKLCKTAIFNLLTNLNEKVSNYPGITVEKKVADFNLDESKKISLEDYPGSYSVVSQSIDEKIVSENIYKWIRQPELKQMLSFM